MAIEEYVDAGAAIDMTNLSEVPGKAPDVAKNVNYERILKARETEPQNWLTYYGAYDGNRYSELDQVNDSNVSKLTPAWVFQCGGEGMHANGTTYALEGCPIVVDGVMYCTGWDGLIWAIDAKTGEELWRYKHAIPFDVRLCCANVNRGAAVADGKVFYTTQNAHLIALDATTGKVVYDITVGDVRAGESMSVAPLIVKDMVITGSSGGEFGVRGHADAFKISTGERVWRTYMIPAPGEPGHETWPADSPAWQRGGANCWTTATFDPDLNLLYFNTGNPCPDFDGEVREGDNLYTDSVVAVDPDTGQIKNHYQYTPHDVWDYDSTMENILFEQDGRKLLAHFDKNGYFFVLDRTDLSLVRVVPFVDRITWGEIDANGKVTAKVYPEKEGDPVHFWPGPAGAKEWTHAAYNPNTGYCYVPCADVGATATRRRREFKEGIPYWGAGVAVDTEDIWGHLSAFDPSTGKEVWRHKHIHPMCGSVLTTKGNLVFAGEPGGMFNAWNAKTGELLWRFQCGSGHHNNPVTYSVDGRQYIAVPTGWGGWVEGFLPKMFGARQGAAIFVFALPE
ncbi:MAG: PQQ-dependent dehydrogenase, methanol/ethanol family [Solirubrobacterales bacterium]|nr:PQQ-dependent dehydrogenase, methanol/ethanol family [Solirubrobacterales bacterium]